MNTTEISVASTELEDALLAMDRAAVKRVLEDSARARKLDAAGLADLLISPALSQIGDQWEAGEVALSQVYMAARILEEVLHDRLEPSALPGSQARIGIGVLEDYHALGKRIVHSVLTSAGRQVVDLGTALSPEAMVDATAKTGIEVLMISVLMFNKALHVAEVVALLRARSLEHVKVVVGGAPFMMDPELWREVGADACGRSDADALRLSRDLLAGGQA